MTTARNWKEVASRIDSALLKVTSSKSDLIVLCKEAAVLSLRSVCVPPYLVQLAAQLLENTQVRVGTVVGFPFGFNTLSSKIHEIRTARQMGAEEIDYVVGLGGYLSAGLESVEIEASTLVTEAKDVGIDVVKAIVEVGHLTREQVREICVACSSSGVNYLKTSTGYGPRPTSPEDVRLMVEATSGRTPVKAAGGIRSLEEATSMFEAGAHLIGTSNARTIVEEARALES